ncbi:dienelactone hydrolase-like protein [Glonium stellatum]|uniref:Dienelactone hydrolase-like protein n=1 Tax=Glonium stellatum TaxID=574774 RepID=A0A8E2JUZ4_9PEZI|nr:dienelactone hydrolase-like protein [Glonium stellatum]
MALQFIANSNGWLSFNAATPSLYITAETNDFDEFTLKAWKEEGFRVKYIPFGNGGKSYVQTLHHLGDGMSIGERYAIVAFGDAASVCLETYAESSTSTSKLCSLVAYYPTSIPDPHTRFSSSFRVLVHLAGGTIGVTRRPEVLGIQGKRRTVQKRITPGVGAGGLQTKIQYPSYTYEDVDPGFAEHDLDEYDPVADAVAWSRSLSVVRRGFGAEVELERVWEENVEYKYFTKNTGKVLETFNDTPDPYVNYTPTMTGGIGKDELKRFYDEFFIPSNPESLVMRLLSRTIGVDQIVDELHITFKHTQEMPWILPGIPPTNKKIEVVVVSVVCLRGGKLYHERVYWDQASVLLQAGLLDPEEVPENLRQKGVEILPVAGAEAARKILDQESEPGNEMIDEW